MTYRWMNALPVALLAFAVSASAQAQEEGAAQPAEGGKNITALAPVSGGLTAEEVARRATATSFELKAKEKAVAAAEAQVDQAMVNFFPRIVLTGRYTRLSKVEYPSLIPADSPFADFLGDAASSFSFETPLDQWHTQAQLQVPISDYILRISRGYAAASKNLKAKQLDQQAQKLKTALDAKVAYYDWLRARGSAEVAEQTLEQAKGHLGDVKQAFAVGAASKADVLRVEAQVAQAEMLVERMRNLARITEDRLRVMMHDTSGRPYTVGENLEDEVVPVAQVQDLEALREEAMSRRLEVKMIEESVGAVREQAKIAKAGMWPSIAAFADAIYANPNSRIFPQQEKWDFTWDAGIQITWSPNDVFASSASGSSVDAQAAQLEAQRDVLLDGIRLEVLQSAQALREALVAIETTQRGLEAAEESYRVRRELFRNGRATTMEVTDAEMELLRARLEALNARVDLRTANLRLEHALGRDVDREVSVR